MIRTLRLRSDVKSSDKTTTYDASEAQRGSLTLTQTQTENT